MRIAVIGGKLQGVEAVYLAQKAGYQTIVIDKNSHTPAAKLCDRFIAFEFNQLQWIPPDIPAIDLILPAVEDDTVLTLLEKWAQAENIPLAFDNFAYSVSRSKNESNRLFQKLNLEIPKQWPNCGFPLVIKPDGASGSAGVKVIASEQELAPHLQAVAESDKPVLQEYLEGPSYSVEIIGSPGKYQVFQVTDLGMDENHDCKSVTAPTLLDDVNAGRFRKTAITLAEEIGLVGVMDIEAIFHENTLKLLEIDARLPSQTPSAVYWSTGINMVEILIDLVMNDSRKSIPLSPDRHVRVEHIKVRDKKIYFLGEHIMAEDGPLTVQTTFFGSDEAITSFSQGKEEWVATMIFSGASLDEVNSKRKKCYESVTEHLLQSNYSLPL